MPRIRRDDDEANETKPHAGLQGEVALAALKGEKTLELRLSKKLRASLKKRHVRSFSAKLTVVIKQGEKIAHQKGWKLPSPPKDAPAKAKAKPAKRRRGLPPSGAQPSLFE